MTDLNTILKRAGQEYQARKSDAESRVVRWEYFSNVAHDRRPFFFERFKVKPGRPLKSATAKAYAYGFDADGQPAVVRQPQSADEPAYEEFFARESAALVTSVAYETNGRTPKPFYATRYDYKAGRLVGSDVLNAGGKDQFTERYTYRDGRLTGVESEARDAKETKTYRFDVQYDEKDGEFKVLRRYSDYMECFLPYHWNPAKEPSLNDLADEIRARLIELIPQVVARAKVRDTVYCLALEYGGLGEELPPTLALGREWERRKWVETLGVAEAAKRLWVPKQYAGYGKDRLDLGDKAFEETCRGFGPLMISKNNHYLGRKVLCDVARALNERDWRGVLDVTDDFIVVPTEAEGHEFKKNLKEAVPADKAKRLQKQKLVYELAYTL